jgi:hypothetical protein
MGHCPPSGARTERARTVGDLLDGDWPTPDHPGAIGQIRADVQVMAEQGLCPRCGYPLDRSEPYPRARASR